MIRFLSPSGSRVCRLSAADGRGVAVPGPTGHFSAKGLTEGLVASDIANPEGRSWGQILRWARTFAMNRKEVDGLPRPHSGGALLR